MVFGSSPRGPPGGPVQQDQLRLRAHQRAELRRAADLHPALGAAHRARPRRAGAVRGDDAAHARAGGARAGDARAGGARGLGAAAGVLGEPGPESPPGSARLPFRW